MIRRGSRGRMRPGWIWRQWRMVECISCTVCGTLKGEPEGGIDKKKKKEE
jgi:hypothetical protein